MWYKVPTLLGRTVHVQYEMSSIGFTQYMARLPKWHFYKTIYIEKYY